MKIVDYISSERLETFERLTDRCEKAIALHNHTLQLGSSLMSMIALIELSVRNATNQQLIDDFGDPEWILSGRNRIPFKKTEQSALSSAKRHAQKSAYSKLSYKEKGYLDAFAYPSGKPRGTSHAPEVKRRTELFVVRHGQIISQTTFYFWKRLYSREYEPDLWKRSLKKIFPNKTVQRSDVSTTLEAIYRTRNRVAHHEPIYGQRLSEAMASIENLRNMLGTKSVEENSTFKDFSRVQYLRLRMDYEAFQEAWRTLT